MSGDPDPEEVELVDFGMKLEHVFQRGILHDDLALTVTRMVREYRLRQDELDIDVVDDVVDDAADELNDLLSAETAQELHDFMVKFKPKNKTGRALADAAKVFILLFELASE